MMRGCFSVSKTVHKILKITSYMSFAFRQTRRNFTGLLISKLSPATAKRDRKLSSKGLFGKHFSVKTCWKTCFVCKAVFLEEGIYQSWKLITGVLPLKRCFSRCSENTNAVRYSLCPFTFSIITVVLWKYHYFLIRTGKYISMRHLLSAVKII